MYLGDRLNFGLALKCDIYLGESGRISDHISM